jgi:THO complex subunit 3
MNKARVNLYPSDTLRPGKPVINDGVQVRSLAWSPLGTQIATATSIVKSIKLWDPEKTRVPVTEFLFRGEKAEKVLYHPLGEPEVVCVGEDGIVRFFDTRTKGASGEIKAGLSCFTLAWSPDGTELVVGKKVDKILHIYNYNTIMGIHILILVSLDRTTTSSASTVPPAPSSPPHA